VAGVAIQSHAYQILEIHQGWSVCKDGVSVKQSNTFCENRP